MIAPMQAHSCSSAEARTNVLAMSAPPQSAILYCHCFHLVTQVAHPCWLHIPLESWLNTTLKHGCRHVVLPNLSRLDLGWRHTTTTLHGDRRKAKDHTTTLTQAQALQRITRVGSAPGTRLSMPNLGRPGQPAWACPSSASASRCLRRHSLPQGL